MCCDEMHRQLLKMTDCQIKTMYWFLNHDNIIAPVQLCFSVTKNYKIKT